jgi:hypothetical protein
MEVTIRTGFFAKRDVDVYSGHDFIERYLKGEPLAKVSAIMSFLIAMMPS